MAGNSPEEIYKARREFLYVLGALAVLTVLTVYISTFDFGVSTNMIVGMSIATVKATLVLLIFMHFKSEKKLIYLFMLMATAGFIICMFLTLMHLFDPIAIG